MPGTLDEIPTPYRVIDIDGSEVDGEILMAMWPTKDDITKIVEPLLGTGAKMERVSVMVNGSAADMFVDENAQLRNLPVNAKATDIYRAGHAFGLPLIRGIAVLFMRPVWAG